MVGFNSSFHNLFNCLQIDMFILIFCLYCTTDFYSVTHFTHSRNANMIIISAHICIRSVMDENI